MRAYQRAFTAISFVVQESATTTSIKDADSCRAAKTTFQYLHVEPSQVRPGMFQAMVNLGERSPLMNLNSLRVSDRRKR